MSEELAEVASPVAPESAPAPVSAQEVPAPAEKLPDPPAEIPVEATTKVEAAAEPQPTQSEAPGPQVDLPAEPAIKPPDTPLTDEGVAERAKAVAEQAAKLGIKPHGAPKFKPKKVNKGGQQTQKFQPRKPERHTPTDDEVKAKWKATLIENGHFEEKFIDALTTYAVEHKGFDPQRSWGGTLVTMFNRMGERLAALPEFSAESGEYIFRQLQKFQMDLANVIGESPDDWNDRGRFEDNYSQRKAVDEYFGINLPLYKINPFDLPLVSIRQAAWPSKKEEERGIGGTFCDRWVYFILALQSFLMDSELAPLVFSKVVHDKAVVKPDWIDENGLCKKCGSAVTEDSHGRQICSSLMCEYHFARSSTSGFVGQGRQQPRPKFQDNAPQQGSWKDRKRDRSDDSERQFAKPGKKHGKKFRVREDDGYEAPVPEANREPVTIQATEGAEKLGNLGAAFGALGL